jgi:hypothetical protein
MPEAVRPAASIWVGDDSPGDLHELSFGPYKVGRPAVDGWVSPVDFVCGGLFSSDFLFPFAL